MAPSGPVRIDALLAHREWAKGLARALVRDPADADDLEQQAWVEALRSPPARDEGLRGWLATILRRRAGDARRAAGRRALREVAAARPEEVRPTAEVVAEAEAHRLVVEALMALGEPERETLLLRFFEDLPPREIAARQGVPVETVRTRTRRGIGRLRERLDARAPGGRAAWVATLVPFAGTGWESAAASTAAGESAAGSTAAAAGGAVMATKAAVTAGVLGALAGSVVGGVAAGGLAAPAPAVGDAEARAEVAAIRGRLDTLESARSGSAAAPAEERFAAQERRIRELESAVDEVRRTAAVPPDPGRAGPEGAGSPARAAGPADRAAAEIAAEAAAMEEARRAADEALAAMAEKARRAFLDRTLDDGKRLEALERLRGFRGIDRPVIAGAVEFFRSSAEAGSRERLLRDLHGTKDDDLKALFLEALRSDPEEKVRVRAAADIDDYLDDASVRQALETARDQDASAAVRERAARTLASPPGKDD